MRDTVAARRCPEGCFLNPFLDHYWDASTEPVVRPIRATVVPCLLVHRRQPFWAEHCGALMGAKGSFDLGSTPGLSRGGCAAAACLANALALTLKGHLV